MALGISTGFPPACSQESHTSTLGRVQGSWCTWAVATPICSGPGTHYSRGSWPTCSLRAPLSAFLADLRLRSPGSPAGDLTLSPHSLACLFCFFPLHPGKKKKLAQNLASHQSVPIPRRPAPGGSPSSSGAPRCHEELSPAHWDPGPAKPTTRASARHLAGPPHAHLP